MNLVRNVMHLQRRALASRVSSRSLTTFNQVSDLPIDQQLKVFNNETTPIDQDQMALLEWTRDTFDGRVAMSTSFGIQSAVLLHMATRVMPDIPVVWVDTGYLPDETYHYAETLTESLGLNLSVWSNKEWSPARMEAIHGKLWEKDDKESHTLYGKMRKVEPMEAGLDNIDPNPLVLLSGLRAVQTKARANMNLVNYQNKRFKALPLLRMTDEQVAEYMDKYDLPTHPLQHQGYVTVGDYHSSRPVEEGEDARNTRFGGKFQECGLHVESHEPAEDDSAADAPPAPPAAVENTPLNAPPSAKKTGVQALSTTPVHPDTDFSVIMVKKMMEDGSYCRKCNDVAGKIEDDGLADWIGYTGVADVRDLSSEGAVLAKHFDVATAPFFLVRSKEEHDAGSEYKVVRSYLQLRKKLQNAAIAVQEKHDKLVEETKTGEVALQDTQEYKEALKQMEDLNARVALLAQQLEESKGAAEETRRYFVEKFADVTDSSSLFVEDNNQPKKQVQASA